ncbi:hypothetical protein DOY81_008988 [Sarcophaga bullata]|nr:hypothetical protein DOY81_008988 [Sarcophaga bullata]
MQCGQAGVGKTFDQDPTILKTSYAQSLEKCNFDCTELSNTQDLQRARTMPKRRFQSQASANKKKSLVSSTPNLNAFEQEDIEDDLFVSSAHTSMHQLPLSQTQKPLGILLSGFTHVIWQRGFFLSCSVQILLARAILRGM